MRQNLFGRMLALLPHFTGPILASIILSACGTAPPEYKAGAITSSPATSEEAHAENSSSSASSSATAREATQEETPTSKPQDKQMTPAPTAPAPAPAPVKLAIRSTPSAAEKTAMTSLYAAPTAQGGCVNCHGALATSAKKGRSAAQLMGVMNAMQHRQVVAANKWPRDLADTTDDGVDQAQLFASALSEILK